MITEQDKQGLEERGISEEILQKQLDCFRRGFPYLDVVSAASIGSGIMQLSEEDEAKYMEAWKSYLSLERTITKFVPASGAASRMFKDLYEFLSAPYNEPRTDFEKEFFEGLNKFAFYTILDKACKENSGKSIEELLKAKEYKTIVENLLLENGLNYGNLPKGLLEFHRYASDRTRTALIEHFVEGNLYARNAKNEINLHFTISPEHREMFEKIAGEEKRDCESMYDAQYNIEFSEQKKSTDTLAVDMDNIPFRDTDGTLHFRPGGHGALIQNLNDLDSDIVFVKNIDNVSPDRLKDVEVRYKQLLAGVLVSTQKKIFEYLDLIDSTKYSHEDLIKMLKFMHSTLNVRKIDTKHLEDSELVLYIKRKLDRPIRVCGMVKNQGEPGGGPFLAVGPDKTIAPQILEKSQIDVDNPEKKAMFEQGTHFNPVDLVCGVKDYRGQSFNLNDFVDKNTGFISVKSKGGKELKALELPGLWNGAMSDWNTVFVEVPISTFSPVKTVNDLLRDEHQN